MYVHKCLHGEYYYATYGICSDIDEATAILAHSTNTWSLCDSAPSFKDNLLVKIDDTFDDWLLQDTRQMDNQ